MRPSALLVFLFACGATPAAPAPSAPAVRDRTATISMTAPIDAGTTSAPAPAPVASVSATLDGETGANVAGVTGLPLAKPAPKIDRGAAKKLARKVLSAPEAVELYRIPWGKGDLPPQVKQGGVGGYAIESSVVARYPRAVGKTVDALIGQTSDDTTKLASCFSPHHAVIARASAGRAVFVMCFECARMEVHVDGYDGLLEWGMRDWETVPVENVYEPQLEALYIQSNMPPAVGSRSNMGRGVAIEPQR